MYCYNLFRHLPPERYKVITDQSMTEHTSPQVVEVRLLSRLVRPRWRAGVRVLSRLAQKYQGELIFTPHILPLGIVANRLFQAKGIPYVISLHGLDIGLALQSKRAVTIDILKSAKHIVVNSDATGRLVRTLEIQTPVTTITPSLDAARLSVNGKTRAALDERYRGNTVLLSVGRLVRRKGFELVIRALPDLLKRFEVLRYCIVGSGPEEAHLRSIIHELQLMKYVAICSDVADGELGAYYDRADLFVLPTFKIGSDVEGFGIVFLEAASFGLPIIAGDSFGEREALGSDENAVFLREATPDVVRDAIQSLLADPHRAETLGENARRRLLTLPTWQQQAKKIELVCS
ncbi:MAG: glycosyltransferase family 4 protein [Patescibacteria group bacterium]